MKTREFYLRIAKALEGCQLLEMELKLFLAEKRELDMRRGRSPRPTDESANSFDDVALGKLIKKFRKASKNHSLADSLEAFRAERDFLAHKAISSCLDYEHEFDEYSLTDVGPRILAIQKNAALLTDKVHEEFSKISAILAFGGLALK